MLLQRVAQGAVGCWVCARVVCVDACTHRVYCVYCVHLGVVHISACTVDRVHASTRSRVPSQGVNALVSIKTLHTPAAASLGCS